MQLEPAKVSEGFSKTFRQSSESGQDISRTEAFDLDAGKVGFVINLEGVGGYTRIKLVRHDAIFERPILDEVVPQGGNKITNTLTFEIDKAGKYQLEIYTKIARFQLQ